jgi:hypothetical protein
MNSYKSKSGFTIIAALGLGFLLAASSIAILSMRRSVENETKSIAVKHARNLAEDIIRTQIAIQQRELTTRVDFLNFVKSFVANPGAGTQGFKMPIPVKCDTGPDAAYCSVRILAVYNGDLPSDPLLPQLNLNLIPPSMKTIRFSLGISDEDNKRLKMKIQPMDMTLKVPTDIEMADKDDGMSSDLKCPLNTPIFKGTKPNTNGQLVADCVGLASFNTVKNSGTKRDILCNIQGGEWMNSVNSNLSPSCSVFPSQIRSPASTLALCPDGKVAKSYELGTSSEKQFVVKKAQCLNKGSPYDFTVQKKTWGVK